MIAGAIMLASGALCLGGAVVSRSRIGIAASAAMVLAMVDLVLVGLVPPVVWAALLLAAGIVLVVGSRQGARLEPQTVPGAISVDPVAGAPAPPTPAGADPLSRAVLIASALAYPAMAWLVLAHGHGAGGAATGIDAHAGHGSFGALLPILVIAPLVATLLGLCATAALRRRAGLAVESGAMAAMLLAMLIPAV